MSQEAVLLKRSEVLKLLSISAPTLRGLVRRNDLSPVKLPSGRFRYLREDIYAFLERMKGERNSESGAEHV